MPNGKGAKAPYSAPTAGSVNEPAGLNRPSNMSNSTFWNEGSEPQLAAYRVLCPRLFLPRAKPGKPAWDPLNMSTALLRSRAGSQPQIAPSNVLQMSFAGGDLPFLEITKSEV